MRTIQIRQGIVQKKEKPMPKIRTVAKERKASKRGLKEVKILGGWSRRRVSKV